VSASASAGEPAGSVVDDEAAAAATARLDVRVMAAGAVRHTAGQHDGFYSKSTALSTMRTFVWVRRVFACRQRCRRNQQPATDGDDGGGDGAAGL
jgi:hypothetical protein